MIRAGDLLERFLGTAVTTIHVRVIFFHQLAVLRLDFCFITGVLEVKHREGIFLARADGSGLRLVDITIAEHAAKGFLELGGGVALELVHAPSGAVAGRRIALEGVDFLFAHALKIVPVICMTII